MGIRESYNSWAQQYDTNENKTRDLEAISLREMVGDIPVEHCLEIGCGTGKNTLWLITKAKTVTAVDLSPEMLATAREKIKSNSVQFVEADITRDWILSEKEYDLVTFSLVLEHVKNLEFVFNETSKYLKPGGYVYVGELHPYKQYSGSKARFETEAGMQVVECYNHHISDFTRSAEKNNLRLVHLNEYFDADDSSTLPRIICLLFQK